MSIGVPNKIKMKQKILIYGNCQTQAINGIVSSDYYDLEQITCHTTDINEYTFKNKIQSADVIITQPISDDYRETKHLSLKFILDTAKVNSKIIVFPSLFGGCYYPDVIYHKDLSGNKVETPCDYHYRTMIKYFLENKSQNQFMDEIVNNENFMSTEEIDDFANSLLNRIEKSESTCKNRFPSIHLIRCANFVKNEWKNKLLFYAINHGTKYMYQYVAENINFLLNGKLNINYEKDPHYNLNRHIVYSCVSEVLNFEMESDSTLPSGVVGTKNVVNEYFTTYHKNNIKWDIDKL